MLSVSIKYEGKKQQYVFPVNIVYFFERRSIIYNKPYIYIYIFIYIYLYTHTPQIKYLLKDTTYHFIGGW